MAGPVRDSLADQDFVRFEPLPPIALKGYALPVAAFAAHASSMSHEAV